jgi:hypothetical protein
MLDRFSAIHPHRNGTALIALALTQTGRISYFCTSSKRRLTGFSSLLSECERNQGIG